MKNYPLITPVLIYDGDCPVCRKAIEWIRKNSKEDAFEMLSFQSGEVTERFPFIKKEASMQAIQLVLPDDKVLSGEKAIPEILKRLKRYNSITKLLSLPGAGIFTRIFYRWFAGRRYHIARVLFPDKERKVK